MQKYALVLILAVLAITAVGVFAEPADDVSAAVDRWAATFNAMTSTRWSISMRRTPFWLDRPVSNATKGATPSACISPDWATVVTKS